MVDRTTSLAKALRKRMTPPEVAFWQGVRDRRLGGLYFRRQVPVSPYVLDFACMKARVAVEIDGATHDGVEQVAYDVRRDAFLRRSGWLVTRLDARALRHDLDLVLAHVRDLCRERLAHSPPARGRSTREAGEEG